MYICRPHVLFSETAKPKFCEYTVNIKRLTLELFQIFLCNFLDEGVFVWKLVKIYNIIVENILSRVDISLMTMMSLEKMVSFTF